MLSAVLLTLGIVYDFNMRGFLLRTTATRLRAQAKIPIDRDLGQITVAPDPNQAASIELTSLAERLSRDLTSRDTTAIIYDRDLNQIADGRRLPEETMPPQTNRIKLMETLTGKNEVDYVTTVAGEDTLVILIPLRRGLGGPEILGVAQLSSPLAPVNQILLRQHILLIFGVILTLLAAFIGTYWLTGSALAPLNSMIAKSRRIAAGDLSQRVNLPHRRDEIGQLAASFDNMVERLEATFAAHKRFVADAAHELRTPLTAVSGSIEVLLRGAQDDREASSRLLRAMSQEVVRLTSLSEQLLDLTRLNQGALLSRRPFDLCAFMREFAEQSRMLARDRHIELDLEVGKEMIVFADADAIKQLLFNLIDNAIQHTAEGGTITLGCRTHNYQIAEITVADNGEGISNQDLHHIFEAFYRGDRSRSRRRGGTGLGLTIANSIVQAHGGQIEAESQSGRGARFTISLPIA